MVKQCAFTSRGAVVMVFVCHACIQLRSRLSIVTPPPPTSPTPYTLQKALPLLFEATGDSCVLSTTTVVAWSFFNNPG